MLTIYRRHKKKCKHRFLGRDYRRCLCPIWVDGLLNGEEIRKSLKTRDWQLAHERVRQWEAEGKRDESRAPVSLKEACDKFVVDAEARGLREPTLYKYRLLFRSVPRVFRDTRLPQPHDSFRCGCGYVNSVLAKAEQKHFCTKKAGSASSILFSVCPRERLDYPEPGEQIETTESH